MISEGKIRPILERSTAAPSGFQKWWINNNARPFSIPRGKRVALQKDISAETTNKNIMKEWKREKNSFIRDG